MVTLRVRYLEEIIAKEKTATEVSRILHVSRKTIYKWLCRYKIGGVDELLPKKPGPKQGNVWNRTPKHIEDMVVQIALKNRFKGPKRLKVLLDQEGVILDQVTIRRILRRRNIRYDNYYVRKKRKKKLYTLDTPGRELQLDTSFPFGRTRKLVVYTAIDDCTRVIYAKAYNRHIVENSIDFMESLMQDKKFEVQAIRTDQGSEFSRKFSNYLHSIGIEHIRNPPYHPEHNGKVERYHRTMREEEVDMWKFTIGLEEANYKLWQRSKYYNGSRGHTGLGMNGLTPHEKLKQTSQYVTLILQ